LPTIAKDDSVIESLKKKNVEKLHSAIIFSSIWDGIGSATLPTLISKFKASTIDSLSIAILPSKIQPSDAHFNAYAAIELCLATEGATVLLLDRDQIEGYAGIDRKGELIKGNTLANYLLNLFLDKDSFNVKLFTPLVVTGASYRIYGSFENMLNTALLKPFLTFDMASASLLYVLLRMPLNMKDMLPRGRIELAITNWFKEKTSLQSIFITEPIYTEDMTDRIDAVLFLGGFDVSKMLSGLEQKFKSLKAQVVEKGFMTEDWKVITKPEVEPKKEEITQNLDLPIETEETKKIEELQAQITPMIEDTKTMDNTSTGEPKIVEIPPMSDTIQNVEEPIRLVKPKRASRTKKAE
jgi:hypothetical protein